MELCPHCRVEIVAPLAQASVCPACGRRIAAEEPLKWTSVARLANLAETGYFADLLQADGVPTNVEQRSEFDAVDGTWRTQYVLQVPEGRAVEAADSLKRELALGEDEPALAGRSEDWRRASAEHAPSGISVWKPLALMLVASGLAYCAGRSGIERPPVARPTHDGLLKVLNGLPENTVFQAEQGGAQLRLTVGEDDTVFLEEDFDRDGQWDRRRMYRDGMLVAEKAN